MNRYILAALYGVLIWVIGYAVGFALLNYALAYIHSAESVLMAFLGMILASYYFFSMKGPYLRPGLELGIIWLVINWVLDFALLVPFLSGGFAEYFPSIGFTYLGIPITTTVFGWALDKKKGK